MAHSRRRHLQSTSTSRGAGSHRPLPNFKPARYSPRATLRSRPLPSNVADCIFCRGSHPDTSMVVLRRVRRFVSPSGFLFDARVPCGPMVTLRQAATLSRKRSAARCCALFFDPALIRDKKRAAAPPFSFCESTGTPKKALFLDKLA